MGTPCLRALGRQRAGARAGRGSGRPAGRRARAAALAARITRELQEGVDAARAIPAPFDQAILGADSGPGRTAVNAAIQAHRRNGRSIVEAAAKLGLSITLDV